MTHMDSGAPIAAPADLSRTRALDLLDQQRRRILDLSRVVSAGQRTLQHSTAALLWTSPARFLFDSRLTELSRTLARGTAALHVALAECDRAREQVLTSLQADHPGAERNAIGSPSGTARR